MKIITKNVNDLIPYENNARINDDAIEIVANSIKEFGFKNPVLIDKNNVIIAGHTRVKACEGLGITEVPCILCDDLTDAQVKAFRIADNSTAQIAQWDFDKLEEELKSIDYDMEMFGLEVQLKNIEENNDPFLIEEDSKYTKKINIPQYEVTGEEPEIPELLDDNKTKSLIEKIKQSKVTEEQKQFLIQAAYRHNCFNYSKIAEYYAHQNKEMQELMEESALVIIDFDDAYKNGYVALAKGLVEALEDDEEQ